MAWSTPQSCVEDDPRSIGLTMAACCVDLTGYPCLFCFSNPLNLLVIVILSHVCLRLEELDVLGVLGEK